MMFNNTRNTATFILKGETIEMKQDTMASGIKYSNSNYEFTEWHGEIELKKDGKIVFSHMPATDIVR
jgi:membrane-bound inhibitor of C-type lysozyme